ncbi:MAG: GH32 C-terminal domain-containing protein [Verrucomicrobia bacterium]|nr:GH32 C-terminal domain-containing protein [Verrucomicrobiota bacterium]
MNSLNRIPIVTALILLVSVTAAFSYDQQWRPRYHYSRECCRVGDPSALIRYRDTYRLFAWDTAQSSDLVHWDFIGWPLHGLPPDISAWTGSVTVDLDNSSGFGTPENPPMIAMYTAHNDVTLEEDIAISVSTNFTDFEDYANNPVINGDVSDFRDPDVIWHEASGKWVCTIARPAESKVAFYSSTDLKTWTQTGQFGPLGAIGYWEVPGLVELPIDGNPDNTKWILHIGRGPSQVQYFVGNFDGSSFTLDPANEAYLSKGTGLHGTLFEDFEATNWADLGWTTSGSAFGSGPASSVNAVGYLGDRLADSSVSGDLVTGSTLTSPPFTITHNCINFLLSGGRHPDSTCINLIVGGEVVRSYTGFDTDQVRWSGWNVTALKGSEAHIEIVDDHAGPWGRIYVDQIMFSDVLRNFTREHANWTEYGWDFYAARAMRDFDDAEQCPVWLAWLCNWDYADDVPVSYLSIPRNLQLVSSPAGYQIAQQPIPRLKQLRGSPVTMGPTRVEGLLDLTSFEPTENAYEIEAVFNLPRSNENAQNFGLNLCVGPTNKVVVGLEAQTSTLYLDRTLSGDVSFSPAFPGSVTAPCPVPDGEVRFHIFVDRSCIEIFMNDGTVVQSALIYPDAANTGIQLFSLNGAVTLRKLTAWPLSSAVTTP